jgi:hypothetical protein
MLARDDMIGLVRSKRELSGELAILTGTESALDYRLPKGGGNGIETHQCELACRADSIFRTLTR